MISDVMLSTRAACPRERCVKFLVTLLGESLILYVGGVQHTIQLMKKSKISDPFLILKYETMEMKQDPIALGSQPDLIRFKQD